jgi:hypothetical protein
MKSWCFFEKQSISVVFSVFETAYWLGCIFLDFRKEREETEETFTNSAAGFDKLRWCEGGRNTAGVKL